MRDGKWTRRDLLKVSAVSAAGLVFAEPLKAAAPAAEEVTPALIEAALAGACLGFLPHNFQPARIFMGDSGSMLIGLTLATISTSASGRIPLTAYGPRDLLGLLLVDDVLRVDLLLRRTVLGALGHQIECVAQMQAGNGTPRAFEFAFIAARQNESGAVQPLLDA